MTARARSRIALVVSTAILAVAPAAAAAGGRVVPLSFAGASCAAVVSESFRLPSAARLAYAGSPVVGERVGATKADRYPRPAMARVTGVDLRGRTLTVTVAADPARCLGSALPGEPPDAAWTAALDADVAWIVPDRRWAGRRTRSLIGLLMAPAFADEARIRCRRAGEARFACAFGTFAGDVSAGGRGSVWIGRDDEVAHYAFRVKSYFVHHRPVRRCVTTDRWKG